MTDSLSSSIKIRAAISSLSSHHRRVVVVSFSCLSSWAEQSDGRDACLDATVRSVVFVSQNLNLKSMYLIVRPPPPPRGSIFRDRILNNCKFLLPQLP